MMVSAKRFISQLALKRSEGQISRGEFADRMWTYLYSHIDDAGHIIEILNDFSCDDLDPAIEDVKMAYEEYIKTRGEEIQ